LRLVEPSARRFPFAGLRLVVGVAVLALVGLLFAGVVLHADLAQRQLRLDRLRAASGDAERRHEQLKLEVAALEAPERIVALAGRLGLQAATGVVFLAPVAPDATVGATGPGGSGTSTETALGPLGAAPDGARGTR
jgi:hypothetical protein